MSSHFLSLSRRIRKTHFTDRVIENGVKGFTVYNHMLLPTYFESVEDDYHHLKREVQIWDVSCERQVEIDGKDSFKLLKIITPRNLEKLSVNKCLYVPLVNSKGFMVNDPVIVKISDYKFWISIADSDVLLWIDGIVSALNLDVKVTEPDISPLAIQGPKSELLASKLFGSKITNLKLFDIEKFDFHGEKLLIATNDLVPFPFFLLKIPLIESASSTKMLIIFELLKLFSRLILSIIFITSSLGIKPTLFFLVGI